MRKIPSATVVIYPAFLAVVFLAPLMRGLFFPSDLLTSAIAVGVVLLIVAVRIFLRREEAMRGALPYAFLALAGAYGVSYFVAASGIEAFRGFLRYLMYFGVFFVADYLARDRKGRRAIALTIFLSATAVALVGLSSVTGVFVFPGASQGARIMSTLQYPNALAAYLMFSSVIGLTLATVERHAALRLVMSVATFCQTLVFLSSYSRGGWVIFPFALAFLFIGMPKVQRARLTYHVCTILTAVLLVVRRFCEAAEGKTPATALKYLLYGVIITLGFEACHFLFQRLSEGLLSPTVRRTLGWIGAMYACMTALAYLVALAGQYSSGVAGIVSSSMLWRLMTISPDDPSLLTRTFASKDALRMFMDRPILGGGAGAWNAWYHGYQKVLYWTSEVHNHLAQVLVETGLLGFGAYIAAWGALAVAVLKFIFRARQRQLMEDSRTVALTWGMFTACLAVGVHSLIDFELSLPAVCVQLWAAFAVVYEATRSLPVLSDRRRKAEAETVAPYARWRLWAVLAAALSIALVLPSYRLLRGASYGYLGAVALVRKDYHTSAKAYQMARKHDPLSACYLMDMGQAYAAMAVLEGNAAHRDRALACLKEARELEPYNLSHRQKEVEILALLGDSAGALDAARHILCGVPLSMQAYERFARMSVASFVAEYRSNGSQISTGSDALLSEVIQLPDRLAEAQRGITGVYQEKWSPDHLVPSSALNMYVGQAYYLSGDLARALTYFEDEVGKGKSSEAEMWRAATRVLLGQIPRSGASAEVLEIVSYYHPAGS